MNLFCTLPLFFSKVGMETLLYVLIGIPVGIAGALLGIGGGIIIVPFLTFVMDAAPQQAVGTSMVVVMLNSISGTVGYIRKKMVVLKSAVIFSIATIPGALIGGYVSDYLRGRIFYVVFGVFFCWFALNMFLKASKNPNAYQSTAIPGKFNWRLGAVCSVGVGFLASILGIGGGVIHVPMMTFLLRFPHKTAVATSTFILAVSSIAGTVSHTCMGHVIPMTALGLGIGAIIGAQIGVIFSPKAKSSILLKATSLIILITGIKFLCSAV